MTEFLIKIIEYKKEELAKKKRILSFSKLSKILKEKTSSFKFSKSILEGNGIIAEIKRASPLKGVFIPEGKIETFARAYQENGASAISLVTEEKYFLGKLDYLKKLKEFVHLPILRKDFIIDEYQILESKFFQADALLLIVTILPQKKLKIFLQLTKELGMEAIVEIHTIRELKQALEVGAEIIGINNRNLKTLKVDINTSMEILPLIPDGKIKIVESGIKDENDLTLLKKFKADGFLIGEALLRAPNPGKKLKKLCLSLEKNDQN